MWKESETIAGRGKEPHELVSKSEDLRLLVETWTESPQPAPVPPPAVPASGEGRRRVRYDLD